MKLIPASIMLTLAACAAPVRPVAEAALAEGRDCFNIAFVQGFSAVEKRTIRLDLGPGQHYDVAIAGPQCDQVDWTQRLALESTSSSWICAGDAIGQGNVSFRDPTTRRRLSCYIEKVRRVNDAPPPS